MPIYKPSELLSFLNRLGITPKKGLSQNFLIDGNIIRKITAAAVVQADELVLEIGPGPGSLTQALLDCGAHVVAVEMDEVLARELERIQTDPQRLDVFCSDIMKFPIQETLKKMLKPGQKAKVIANLPYHLTTPILALLIPMHELISSLTVMVQEEVGRRMTAKAGTPEYGSLTVFLEFYSNAKYAFTVSRNCFYPSPKVDSAIIVLELRKPPLSGEQEEQFFKITRTSFGHRRKMLRASLKELYDPAKVTKTLEDVGLNPLARPEDLSMDEFLRLAKALERD